MVEKHRGSRPDRHASRTLRDQARDIALRELAPLAAEIDCAAAVSPSEYRALGQLGLLAVAVPKEWGGGGGDTVAAALVVEELASACASTAAVVSVQDLLVCDSILRFGSDAQKREWLAALSQGARLGGFALTEDGGSGPASVATLARREGDGYVVRGSKSFVSSAPVADVVVVFALTAASVPDSLSAFLVPTSTRGVSVGPVHAKLGLRGAVSSAMVFDDVRLPAAALLGPEGAGGQIVGAALDGGRILAAAMAVGIARAAFGVATRYAQARHANGEAISNHQAVQFKLAEMSTHIDAARLLTWRAAAARDAGGSVSTYASMAKVVSSETATCVASDAISVLGGNGCLADYPVERHFRDAKVTEIYEGTSEIQRLGIASALLKE